MFKFGYFESISINFLIITKFCLYPISKVLISNLTFAFENFKPKSPNFSILDRKNINLLLLTKFCLHAILGCWFQTWHSLSVVLSLPSTHVTRTNSMPLFCNLFEKGFFVFSQKFQNFMASIVMFFGSVNCKYNIKKSKHIKPHNFEILRNKMNEKAGFEIILTRYEQVSK